MTDTTTNTTVSVVIPTYNRAYCLPAAIGSLQQQTYRDWEAVIIDDGSKDNTADVVKAISAQDPRVKYHYQKNGGVSAARNTGLRLASGAWVGFLDSDDTWDSWKLSAQIACFSALPEIGMVWTDMNAVDADGNLVSPRHLRHMYSAYSRIGNRQIFQHQRALAEIAPDLQCPDDLKKNTKVCWGDIYSTMIYGNIVHTSTVLMTRQRVQETGFFDENFRTGEDYDFHLRSCRAGPSALIDAPAIGYRIAGGSDQLTSNSHMVEMSINGLRTQEAAIARDRQRVDLTNAEIADILASSNVWVASELFDAGEFIRARPHYRRSLRKIYNDPKQLLKALITHLPPALADVAIKSIRAKK
ncbi:MAG: glycosyltransferase [Spongiibacteraceae bacterium]